MNYPGRVSHPQHELAGRLLDGGYGAMLSFRVEDDLEKVDEMIHRLKVIRYLGTLGGIRTSLAHPATAVSYTHLGRQSMWSQCWDTTLAILGF